MVVSVVGPLGCHSTDGALSNMRLSMGQKMPASTSVAARTELLYGIFNPSTNRQLRGSFIQLSIVSWIWGRCWCPHSPTFG